MPSRFSKTFAWIYSITSSIPPGNAIRGTKHYGMSGRHHSGLMLAALMIGHHFSISAF
jgi:hypothetical protein